MNPTIPTTPNAPIIPPQPAYGSTFYSTQTGQPQGTVKFDSKTGAPLADPNATSNTNTSNTGSIPSPYTGTPDQSNTISTAKTNLDTSQKAEQDAATTFANTVTNIQNGSIPLSAGEQAQVSGLQSQYQQLIENQKLQNTNAGGVANIRGYQTGAAEYDPSFQAKTIGAIFTAGQNKLATLNTQMAGAVATLTQSLKDNDIAKIKESYDTLKTAGDDRQKALQKTIDDTQAAIDKATKDYYDQVTKPIQDIAAEAAKNGADKNTLAAINSASSVNDALNAAGDSLQTASGQLGDYLQYKRDAIANGLVPQDYATWKKADDAQTAKEKASEAYGTAFATAKGKAAGESSGVNNVITSPVTSSSGLIYNAPASIAPYVGFASNGVKYVDMSSFAGTPTEKNQAVQDAQKAGYKVITNKNTALDVQNITDANLKLDDMQKAFAGITQDSATSRALYGAAITTMAKKFQTDPNVVGADIYQDAALDILKAMSGVQGFRGGASIVQQVKDTFPSATDTTAVADAKINTLKSLITDRETALVGKPSASDQALIDSKNNENNITTNLNKLKTTDPKLYSAASSMFTSLNPDTGQPYSAADILQAFPELNQ